MIENESGEDYLEAILRLSSSEKEIHAVQIARELGVSKPAVTKALRILTEKGYVSIASNRIVLTESGEKYAAAVYEKHRTITRFFVKLGVDEPTAEADACRMEHLVSPATYEAIKRFTEEI